MRSCLDEVGPCAHLCSFVLIDRRHSSLGPGLSETRSELSAKHACVHVSPLLSVDVLWLAVLSFCFYDWTWHLSPLHTLVCLKHLLPAIDLMCSASHKVAFPWLPRVVPALVPLLWPSLSSPMLTFAPAGKGLVGSAPSCVPEFGMVPGLKEEFLSSLSFLLIF